MFSKMKLTYFHAMGLAEPIRYLLAYGTSKFEDCRVEYDSFLQMKSSLPFGQLPVVEHDGKIMFQSIAICRFLGKKLDLVGSGDYDELECDAVVDTITDYRLHFKDLHFTSDLELRAKKREALLFETSPFYLSRFELTVNGNGGHFVKPILTWADIYFAGIMCFMESLVHVNLLEEYPSLEILRVRVNSLPGIKEWIASRPKTDL